MKHFHFLKPKHHEHLSAIGVPWKRAPFLMIDATEYKEAYEAWKQTFPKADHEELHMRAMGHAAWKQHCAEASKPDHQKVQQRHNRLIYAVLLLLGILALAPKLHCQFSHVNYINFQQGGSNISGAFFTYPFNVNCGANLTCTPSGNTLTIVAGAGGTVAWDAILNPTAGSLSLTQFANGNDFWIVKRNTDTAPTGSFFRFQNAAGSDLCALSIAGVFSSCSFPYANLTGTPQLAQTLANASHKWLNSYSATTGLFTQTQPACADISDAGTLCTSSAALPANTTATASNFFTAYNSTTGAFTKARPVCADLSDSGTLCTSSAALAANTTATASNFFTAYNSTTGAFTKAQPAFTDISGTATTAQLPGSGATTVSGATCTLGSTCTVTRICSDGIGDGLNAIPAGTYLSTNCFNDFGATYTITNIRCFTDNSGSSTLNAANDGATGLLTGAVTCTTGFAAGTQSATTTITTSHWINFTFVADGTSKRATFEVTVTR